MPLVPQNPEIVAPAAVWQRTPLAQPMPNVEVAARTDKVLYGTKGEQLIRIVDRPIGFRRP